MVQRPLATMFASVSPVPAKVPSGLRGISVRDEGFVDVWPRRADEASTSANRRECCQWPRNRCTIGQPRQSGLQALLRPAHGQPQACRRSDQKLLDKASSAKTIFPSCRCRPRRKRLPVLAQKVPLANLVLRCAGNGGGD